MSGAQLEGFTATITKLSTVVTRPNGSPVDVYAVSTTYKFQGKFLPGTFLVQLRTASQLDQLNECKDYEEFDSATQKLGHMLMGYETKGHILIYRIDNLSGYKKVGTALEEYAYRASVEQGFGGRVELIAAWNSHVFHYLNGFRADREADNVRIRDFLATAREEGARVITETLGTVLMKLPEAAINEMKDKYKIAIARTHITDISKYGAATHSVADIQPPKPSSVSITSPDVLQALVLPLLTESDVSSLYKSQGASSQQAFEKLMNAFPELSNDQFQAIAAWAFKQGDTPLLEATIAHMKARHLRLTDPLTYDDGSALEIMVHYGKSDWVDRVLNREQVNVNHWKYILPTFRLLEWSLLNKQFDMVRLLGQKLDFQNISESVLIKMVENILGTKSHDRDILQYTYILLSNTHHLNNETSVGDQQLDYYKLLLKIMLGFIDQYKKPVNVFDAQHSGDELRGLYHIAMRYKKFDIVKAFLDYAGRAYYPVEKNDKYLEAKNIRYTHGIAPLLPKDTPASAVVIGEFHDTYLLSKQLDARDSKLYYFDSKGRMEEVVHWDLQSLYDTISRMGGQYGSSQVMLTGPEVYDYITSKSSHNPSITVIDRAISDALEAKDIELSHLLLMWMRKNELVPPFNAIEKAITAAAYSNDILTFKMLVENTPACRLPKLLCPIYNAMNQTGMFRRDFSEDIKRVVESQITLCMQAWVRFIESIEVELRNTVRYPRTRKSLFVLTTSHCHEMLREKLLNDLALIKQSINIVDFSRGHFDLYPKIRKALSEFIDGVNDLQDDKNTYYESFKLFFGGDAILPLHTFPTSELINDRVYGSERALPELKEGGVMRPVEPLVPRGNSIGPTL